VLLQEGKHDIWRWKNNAFEKVFDQYKWELSHTTTVYWHATQLTTDNKGNGWFAIGTEIYRISPNAKAELMADLKKDKTSATQIGGDYLNYFFIEQVFPDEKGKLQVICRKVSPSLHRYDFRMVMLFDPAKGEIEPSESPEIYASDWELMVHKTGSNRWALGLGDSLWPGIGGRALSISQDEDYPLYFSSSTLSAVSPQGLHVILTEDGTLIFRKANQTKWEKIPFFGVHISAMGFDHLGNFYLVSSQKYTLYCDGTAGALSTAGLYRIDAVNGQFVFTRISNPVNEKVLSITTWPGKGLLLGTSGSGWIGVEISK
jgi:hypothetical protein